MIKLYNKSPVVGVDFHVWDGIFQGSRSHLIGIYLSAIRQAPDINFVFFLDGVDSLRSAYPEFGLPNVRLVRMRSLPSFLRLAVQLPWLQWRNHVDLLHMQYRLPLLRFSPCACTIHDILFETHPQFFSKIFVWQSKLTFRMAAKKSALLFSVSNFSKQQIIDRYKIQKSKIYVTYNGVDFKKFHQIRCEKDEVSCLGLASNRYILTVGRLEPRKNHINLIKAYYNLGEDAPPLVIVGQKDFGYKKIFEMIRLLDLDGRVIILDSVGDEMLPKIIRNAKIFVYPAFAEGFGMPVIEAMASGVPVISSNSTSLPEVTGGAALLVDPYSVEQIEAAIKNLLIDENLRSECVRRGLEKVREFDWDKSAAVLIDSVRNFFIK